MINLQAEFSIYGLCSKSAMPRCKDNKNWELSIKKDKLEEELVTRDFDKRSAQEMINALTE
jgi:hypothetical protein